MTAVDVTRQRAAQLREQARSARSYTLGLRVQARELTEVTAAIEDQLAVTFDELAREQPERAGHLRDMGESARKGAARRRERLVRRPCDGDGLHCHDAAARATAPEHADDLPIIEERDRIAARLLDTVIGRVFAAGLSLESAAGLTASPGVRSRIEAAVTELDEVIREIRNAVFQNARPPDGHLAGQDIPALSRQLATGASVSVTGQAAEARLLPVLQVILSLIGEHATPSRVDVTASSYNLVIIEAASLAPGESAGQRAGWTSAVQARAAMIGVSVAVEPTPGGTRFICELLAA